MENNPRNRLNVEILSPEGSIYKDTASEIALPTAQGEITVLPSHTPLFAKLAGGEVVVRGGKEEIYITISGGFLEVLGNRINVLADYAIRSEAIEAQKAEEARRKAEQLVKEKKDKHGFALAERDLQRSVIELKIADKMKRRQRKPG